MKFKMGICKSKKLKINEINQNKIIDEILNQNEILNLTDLLVLNSSIIQNKIIIPKNSILIKYRGHTFGMINNRTSYAVKLILYDIDTKKWKVQTNWRSINKIYVNSL
jgi:hypothetical protein